MLRHFTPSSGGSDKSGSGMHATKMHTTEIHSEPNAQTINFNLYFVCVYVCVQFCLDFVVSGHIKNIVISLPMYEMHPYFSYSILRQKGTSYAPVGRYGKF